MKTTFFTPFFIFLFFSQQSFSQYKASLDVNNVKADFIPFNQYFTDSGMTAGFEFPKGSGVNAIFASSFWLSGMSGNELKVFANTYMDTSSYGYTSGPIGNIYDAAYTAKYQRVFPVTKQEIDYHISHYNQPGYSLSHNISQWPGNGNLANGEAQNLAPYMDVNNNGKYEPNLGEYPIICGDKAIFILLKNTDNPFSAQRFKFEMHVMAYSFASTTAPLKNTVFMKVNLLNRSNSTLEKVYFSNFLDYDLGCFINDYIGFDSTLNLGYSYNSVANDSISCGSGVSGYGKFPVSSGVTFLNQKTSSGIYFNNGNGGPQNDPSTNVGFRNYMLGKWNNGFPYTYSLNGYDSAGTITTNFVFSGDPTDSTQWSEVHTMNNTQNVPGDRRLLSTIYLDTFSPSKPIEINLAYVSVIDSTLAYNQYSIVHKLKQDVQTIRNEFNSGSLCNMSSGISELNSPKFEIFPNPTTGKCKLICEKVFEKIEILDLQGKLIQHLESNNTNEITLNLSNLTAGIYFIQIKIEGQLVTQKLILE